DTGVVAVTDMQGRLMGKRVDAEYFVESSSHGECTEGCNYLLTVDMEMDPVPGYEMASWERGYGDFDLRADFSTLRRIPWLEATALVLCDVGWHDGSPVRPSPRQVLRGQIERARQLGFEPMFGSELEFYLLKETYAEAYHKRYRDLTPSVHYNLDYHIRPTTRGSAAHATCIRACGTITAIRSTANRRHSASTSRGRSHACPNSRSSSHRA